ncbi:MULTISPECIES: hypothetical protein [Agrobacterium]|nr:MULTISPECIES: hypothetical protein [Agrobacterium]
MNGYVSQADIELSMKRDWTLLIFGHDDAGIDFALFVQDEMFLLLIKLD